MGPPNLDITEICSSKTIQDHPTALSPQKDIPSCFAILRVAPAVWRHDHLEPRQLDYFAISLLGVVFLYPAVYAGILAVQVLRDHQWNPKDAR